LSDLTAFGNLTTVGGMVIEFNDALTDLEGFENITSLPGGIDILVNEGLSSLNGLENISFAGGVLIQSNFALLNLEGLQNLVSVERDLIISNNHLLGSLSGLENLISVGENLTIMGNQSLVFLSGLDNLTSVGNSVYLRFNDSMETLTGIENLVTIGNSLNILNNGALTSLMGIDSMNLLTASNLAIAFNPLLSFCSVQSVCDYLNIPSNPATISENASGCKSRPGVEFFCDITGTVTPSQDHFSIFPNPALDKIEISGYEEGLLEISDSFGRSVNFNFSNQFIDISDLPSGMYFISIRSKEGIVIKRFIKI
jgi:hypothetical protein